MKRKTLAMGKGRHRQYKKDIGNMKRKHRQYEKDDIGNVIF